MIRTAVAKVSGWPAAVEIWVAQALNSFRMAP
jgi:hypothetical protein